MPAPSPAGPESGDAIGRKSFEDALAELEEIVAQLEGGAKPLDESLDLYEKGVGALKHCHGILDKAEKRIRLLVKNAHGEPELRETELPNAKADMNFSSDNSKNSAQLAVDSEPPPRQNPTPSVKPKPRTATGKPGAAGGSLFGSSQ